MPGSVRGVTMASEAGVWQIPAPRNNTGPLRTRWGNWWMVADINERWVLISSEARLRE